MGLFKRLVGRAAHNTGAGGQRVEGRLQRRRRRVGKDDDVRSVEQLVELLADRDDPTLKLLLIYMTVRNRATPLNSSLRAG